MDSWLEVFSVAMLNVTLAPEERYKSSALIHFGIGFVTGQSSGQHPPEVSRFL
jgi:hypothetical protein